MGHVRVEFVEYESVAAARVEAIARGDGTVDASAVPWEVPPELVDDYSDGQFEPLTLIAASVSIAFLVKTISSVVADHTRPGGQVVDARGEKVSIRPAPHLERGTVVIVSDAGPKVIKTKDPNDISAAMIAAIGRG